MRPSRLPTALGSLLRPSTITAPSVARPIQSRWSHKESAPPTIPSPIPLVPDVQTFLTVIGRGLTQHAAKFPTWEALFSLTSPQLRELGIEPPRTRRYLIQWREKFRLGQFGPGGDLKHVDNGVAELKVVERGDNPLKRIKQVVNLPVGKTVGDVSEDDITRVKGYHVHGAHTIVGPYALPTKDGQGARITVTEGMWEDRRGHKVDGGERRRAEIRFKRRAAERRAQREKMGFY